MTPRTFHEHAENRSDDRVEGLAQRRVHVLEEWHQFLENLRVYTAHLTNCNGVLINTPHQLDSFPCTVLPNCLECITPVLAPS